MYIKVRKFGQRNQLWEYAIYSNKKRIICTSIGLWKTIGGAEQAAIKSAIDLDIEYRE